MEIVTIALVSVGGIAVCALAHMLATSRNRILHDADDEPGIAIGKADHKEAGLADRWGP